MNLYLSSYGLGNSSERISGLVKDGAKIAVIANACDTKDEDSRSERVSRELLELSMLGLKPEELDLRKFYEKKLKKGDLDNYDGFWVRGGNVFNLRRSMAMSGFDKLVKDLIHGGTFYGGYSAGVCVLSNTLKGIELCDPTDDVPNGMSAEVIWDGLGVLNYSIAPHYRSNHPESAMIDEVVAYFETHNMLHKTIHDGDVIVVRDDCEEFLS